jgi:uncharacterized protein (TIGR01244 family)
MSSTYDFPAWFQVCPQLAVEAVPLLAQQGFRSLINNRPDGEGGAAQASSELIAAQAQAVGLAYAYLPVVPGQVTLTQIEAMRELLQTLPRPILAFCRSGARSGELFALAT